MQQARTGRGVFTATMLRDVGAGAGQRNRQKAQLQSTDLIKVTKSCRKPFALMRKLTAIAVSTITHARNMLPSECYTTHFSGGLYFKGIEENPSTENSYFIGSSLQAALEAFDMRYLHRLEFSLYEDESKPETLLESYIFSFDYTENSASVSLESNSRNITCRRDDDKTMSIKRMMNIIAAMCQELKYDLPPDYDICFCLYYYDDVTPVDYMPPGLKYKSDEMHMFPNVPVHVLSHKVRNNEITAIVSDDELEDRSGTSAPVSTINYSVRCPCLVSVSPSSTEYVQCISCNTAQHPACFGLTHDDIEAIESHVCDECPLENPQLECSDPVLVYMKKKEKKIFCIWRRVLLWSSGVLHLNEEQLTESFHISKNRTRMFTKQLECKQLIYPLPPGEENTSITERKVNKQALRMILPKYFHRKVQIEMLNLINQLHQQANYIPQESTEVDNLRAMPNTRTLGKVTNKPAAKRSEAEVPHATTHGTKRKAEVQPSTSYKRSKRAAKIASTQI